MGTKLREFMGKDIHSEFFKTDKEFYYLKSEVDELLRDQNNLFKSVPQPQSLIDKWNKLLNE